MTLTPDQNVRFAIGEMFVQNALLSAQVDDLTGQIKTLQSEVDGYKSVINELQQQKSDPLVGEVLDSTSNG